MGIEFGKEKGTKTEDKIMRELDILRSDLKSARYDYKMGAPAMTHSGLGNLIWHAQQLRETIKREYPEYWK